ncbi:MAG: tetratricopeptide repeat protein [Bacteroidetes bacterium]|nr:tetratricopeptide repeat protein [Bacteroidota bacterium]
MKLKRVLICILTTAVFSLIFGSCNFITHRTISKDAVTDSTITDPEPDYDVSLDFGYQDFTSYLFLGNRVENFTAYFNTFFKAQEDYDDAFKEFRASFIAVFNRRIDSLLVNPPVSQSVKDKLNKSIERSSKIIQFHKNSKFIDDAVLLIGKSYYFLTDYISAERKFNEFLSKFSSSDLTDEAILFLARTKNKLGKEKEAESIYKNLLNTETDGEIKSLAARDYGVLQFIKGNSEEAAKYFRMSIEYTNDNVRKAEGQFILAKLLSLYKPELAASEYKKVLDYTSDYDLSFYGRLNYAIGLSYNKKFSLADEELSSLRKKYRDEPAYAQLVDLEIANNFYSQKKLKDAMNKYYEVIVKYPGTIASSDAYYFLGRHEELVNNDYLKALVNYKKAAQESSASEYNREVSQKVIDLDRYFTLQSEVRESKPVVIPQVNADVEKFRAFYNEEKGIEQFDERNKNGNNNGNENNGDQDGSQRGDGKGNSGGINSNSSFGFLSILRDSVENNVKDPNTGIPDGVTGPGKNNNPDRKNGSNNPGKKDNTGKNDGEVKKEMSDSNSAVNDSLRKVQEEIEFKQKEDKIFNGYYELAELFSYKLNRNDSAEFYLNLLLEKFPEPEKQAKVLYTLGNFYKTDKKNTEADKSFGKLIAEYPNSIYSLEAKKILGIKISEEDINRDTTETKFKDALEFFSNKNYTDAIQVLQIIRNNAVHDSLRAKAIYTIGYIYENGQVNKDSSIYYYELLRSIYPQSVYAVQVSPMLDYIASLEDQQSKDSLQTVKDSTNSGTPKTEGDDLKKGEEINPDNEKKESDNNEVKPDESGDRDNLKLSPEDLEKMLKDSEKKVNDPPGN